MGLARLGLAARRAKPNGQHGRRKCPPLALTRVYFKLPGARHSNTLPSQVNRFLLLYKRNEVFPLVVIRLLGNIGKLQLPPGHRSRKEILTFNFMDGSLSSVLYPPGFYKFTFPTLKSEQMDSKFLSSFLVLSLAGGVCARPSDSFFVCLCACHAHDIEAIHFKNL